MFSPLNDPQVEQWFARFSAPLKHLPAEERAELHAEVRQHLDALVAANEELGSSPEEAWELALTQFGDPARVGRRLGWEWRRGQRQVSPDMAAVLCGLRMHVAATVAGAAFARTLFALGLRGTTDMTLEYILGVPILVGLVIGRKYPQRALAGALSGTLVWPILPMVAVFPLFAAEAPGYVVAEVAALAAGWFSVTCGAAYLASVTRRGWYKPTLADFKLTLPRKRARLSR